MKNYIKYNEENSTENCQSITEDLIILLKNTQSANKTISERINVLEKEPQQKL